MLPCRSRRIALLACGVLFWGTAAAQPLPDPPGPAAETDARRTVRWAADASSGAPYVFQDPRDPSRLVGFEVDLIEALARELDVEMQFVQNDWDSLIPGLQRGQYDLVVNGLEITPDRAREVRFSQPYYLTFEQLTLRQGSEAPRSLEECRGRTVGTLQSSLASRILRDLGGVDVREYDDEINAYQDLENGRLDAVLLDHPIALYYAFANPRLEQVDAVIGRLSYGLATRLDDEELGRAVDEALGRIMARGDWARILARWNLWNPLVAEQLQQAEPRDTEPTGYELFLDSTRPEQGWRGRLTRYGPFMPLFARGAVRTLQISMLAMIVAVVVGLAVAIVRLFAPRPLAGLAMIYVEVVRGTPLLIQLFFIFYALPNLGVRLSPMVAAVLGLGLNYAAYESENYRAGILSVPRGQLEAALALGMSRRQAFRHVVLPQSVRLVLPPVTNDFISLLKDSSLVSVITMVELTKTYTQVASTTFDYLGPGLIVAAMYLLLGLPFVRLARWTERRLAVGQLTVAPTRTAQPGLPPGRPVV